MAARRQVAAGSGASARPSRRSSERLGRIWNLTQGHKLLGEALLSWGDQKGAVAHLEEAVRLAERSGVRTFIDKARITLDRARQAGQ